ncbi:MAG TPA: cell wall hydrolase [Aestuariivirgaceae bacterium]|nr:cell wall hydrolase [Aestuariivirgaceae bacterium]
MQTGRGATPRRSARRKTAERRWRKAGALTVAGASLVGLFAIAGYHVGSAAVTPGFATLDFDLASGPTAPALRKSSLFSSEPLIEVAAQPATELAAAERPVRASLVSAKSDILSDILGKPQTVRSKDPMMGLVSPPIDLIEKTWQMGRELRRQVAEHQCLARAIYFEARSESEIGRLAVARVILNRVQSPFYPDTICEVVYQNAEKRNACQFSFTCDGLSDRPRNGKAWQNARTLASQAIAGEGEVEAVATATNYHADYVQPKWSGAMTRLVKIGRHIFYSGS